MKRISLLALAVASLLTSTASLRAQTLSINPRTATVEYVHIAQPLPEPGGTFPMVIRFVGDPADYRASGLTLAHAMLLRPGDQVQFSVSAASPGQLSALQRIDTH